ncbi:caspase family protein [Sorangium sp. So ce1097]|uniref:caspase family protein n=1 Tax=Sorangium sp. So ce1097 TaxID=3133330 RepID=UPI003F612E3F
MMEGEPNDEHDEAGTSSARDTGPTFRALLIGIDLYVPNRLPSDASYESLSGCVNDVGRVEDMLRARVTGPIEIKKLLSYSAGARPPDGTRSDSDWPTPTYANMKAAFDALVARAQPGDQVYIHYSGHGGRVPTRFEDLKGAGRYDETLVPMDIGESSTRHLRDVDIAYYLDALTRKTQAIVTVVLDSCHSGGATRGVDVAPRCATGARAGADPTLDTTERPADGVAPDDELRAAWRRFTAAGAAPGAAAGTTWLPESSDYVLLAACRDDQSAAEVNIEGARRGVMTEAFLKALARLDKEQSWKTLYERVLAWVHSHYPTQTPQLLGRGERQVLGVELRQIAYTVTVIEIDETSRKVRLRAGRAMGIVKGSRFGIYGVGTTDFTQRDERVGAATVSEVTATESWAALDEDTPIARVELGAPAQLEDVGSVSLRRAVNLFRRDDLPAGIDQERSFDALRAAIETRGRGFLVLQTDGTPYYQVAINHRDHYEIWDPLGKPMPNVGGVDVHKPNAAEHVVDRLLHILRYQTILEIEDPFSVLKDALRVELRAPPPGWSPGDWMQGGTVIEPSGDAYAVKLGTHTFVRVVNESDRRVNVVAIDLEEEWGIAAVMPPGPAFGYYTAVDARKDVWFALEAILRPGRSSAVDVIKIFATVDDADFWWLLHPPIDQPITRSARTRSTAARNALFRLREALDADRNTERAVRVISQPGSDWTVRQFRLAVR